MEETKMKRVRRIITVMLILAMLLTVPSLAAQYSSEAETLDELGLLLGTTSSSDKYALDRAPTRTEAAVMLLRLMGVYDEAGKGGYSHPFTDVPKWADSYIGYMYENGLTKGVSATKFGADTECTAQMYCIFVLRAMGYNDVPGKPFSKTYSDEFTEEEYQEYFDEYYEYMMNYYDVIFDEDGLSGDFLYYDATYYAYAFAEIMDDNLYYATVRNDTFLRDHMVGVTYNALYAKPMNSEHDTLIEKLSSMGVVPKEIVTIFTEKISSYNAIIDGFYKTEEIAATACDMSSRNYLKIEGEVSGEKITEVVEELAKLQFIDSGNGIKMSLESSEIYNGYEFQYNTYLKDGYVYYHVKEESEDFKDEYKEKYKTNYLDLYNYSTTPSDYFYYSLIAMSLTEIDSITKQSVGSNTEYTVNLKTGSIDDMLALLFEQDYAEGLAVSDYGYDIELKYVIDSQGRLIKVYSAHSIWLVDTEGDTAKLTLTSEITINALGGSVYVQYPSDLHTYEEYKEY